MAIANGGHLGPNSELVNPIDPRTYEPMDMPFDVRYCMHPGLKFWERPDTSNGFCVVDGSEYKASLITGPEFGCVRWAKRST